MSWVPGRPNVKMIRTKGYDEAVTMGAGAFYWQVRKGNEYSLPVDGERPTHFYFIDNRDRFHMLPIDPVKGSNGAGWAWNGDLDKPTLSPSILSSGRDAKGNTVTHWHGFVRDGVVGFEC